MTRRLLPSFFPPPPSSTIRSLANVTQILHGTAQCFGTSKNARLTCCVTHLKRIFAVQQQKQRRNHNDGIVLTLLRLVVSVDGIDVSLSCREKEARRQLDLIGSRLEDRANLTLVPVLLHQSTDQPGRVGFSLSHRSAR